LLPRLLTTGVEPPAGAVKLNAPRVQMRNNEASATRSPWIDSNGWRMIRTPEKQFYYQVTGPSAALAAAEAFTYGSDALISADASGKESFEKMLAFLTAVPEVKGLAPVADIGVIDDGSDETGELLNLLTRQNLLFRIEKAPDPKLAVNVRIGSKEFPKEEAANPSFLSHKIRSQVGDDKRSIRVYGSEVVVSRFLAGPKGARVYLINYANRPVLGLRVRLKGAYAKGSPLFYGSNGAVQDWTQENGSTEFTITELGPFAVIDLSK
jgi:hypothetical protein